MNKRRGNNMKNLKTVLGGSLLGVLISLHAGAYANNCEPIQVNIINNTHIPFAIHEDFSKPGVPISSKENNQPATVVAQLKTQQFYGKQCGLVVLKNLQDNKKYYCLAKPSGPYAIRIDPSSQTANDSSNINILASGFVENSCGINERVAWYGVDRYID